TNGIAVEGPGAATLQLLAQAGITVAPARLVDLTTAGTRYDVMKPALDVLLAALEFDLVLAVVGSSARFHPELAAQPVLDHPGAAGPADHRGRRRRKPAGRVPGPRGAGRVAGAERRRHPELPYAGSLRRRHRGGVPAGASQADRGAGASACGQRRRAR